MEDLRWEISPTREAFCFEWRSNFGFAGRAVLAMNKLFLGLRSSCCLRVRWEELHPAPECGRCSELAPAEVSFSVVGNPYNAHSSRAAWTRWIHESIMLSCEPLAAEVLTSHIHESFVDLLGAMTRLDYSAARSYADRPAWEKPETYEDLEHERTQVWLASLPATQQYCDGLAVLLPMGGGTVATATQ